MTIPEFQLQNKLPTILRSDGVPEVQDVDLSNQALIKYFKSSKGPKVLESMVEGQSPEEVLKIKKVYQMV